MNNYKIDALLNKKLLSTVYSQIVKNIKLLLIRARPGFSSALCSMAVIDLKQSRRN